MIALFLSFFFLSFLWILEEFDCYLVGARKVDVSSHLTKALRRTAKARESFSHVGLRRQIVEHDLGRGKIRLANYEINRLISMIMIDYLITGGDVPVGNDPERPLSCRKKKERKKKKLIVFF